MHDHDHDQRRLLCSLREQASLTMPEILARMRQDLGIPEGDVVEPQPPSSPPLQQFADVAPQNPPQGLLILRSFTLSRNSFGVHEFVPPASSDWQDMVGGCTARLLSLPSTFRLVCAHVGSHPVINNDEPVPLALYNLVSFHCPMFGQGENALRVRLWQPYIDMITPSVDLTLMLYDDRRYSFAEQCEEREKLRQSWRHGCRR